MTDPTVDRILAALADLAPACRAWVPPPECSCWSGIQQAIDTVRKVAGDDLPIVVNYPKRGGHNARMWDT